MDNDDRPVGRILSRREVLALLGIAGASAFVACTPAAQTTQNTPASPVASVPTATSAATTPPGMPSIATVPATPTTNAAVPKPTATAQIAALSCVVKPEQTEGPYFVDEKLNRSDIRADPSDNAVKPGVPLQLAFRVSQIAGDACTPLSGAQVDVWHCDALGVYSDVQDRSFGNTQGKKFLRGYQVTDAQGIAKFITIYPGWYQGRAVHIHFKIRTKPASNVGHEFTSQLYFDDALTDQIHAQAPYASKGQRNIRNEADGIYSNGGSQLLLNLTKEGDGYTTTFDIAMQMT